MAFSVGVRVGQASHGLPDTNQNVAGKDEAPEGTILPEMGSAAGYCERQTASLSECRCAS
ncbi:hypothetical protein HHA02_06860 [Cobetia marina]|nr:hypothetical protein HHA02_06860 [Cobetia marina]